jgi:uncharacterized protein DUF6340
MKHSNALPAYLVIFLLTILCACEPVAKIHVLQPAAVALPDNLHTIMILNRSHYGSDLLNSLFDGLFNSENVGLQNAAKRQAVHGLDNKLTETSRFKVKLSKIEMEGTGGNSFPDPLSWTTVDSICKENSCDAIVALEYYYANATTNKSQREVTSKDKDDKEVTTTEYTVNGTTTISLGWRLYDSKTHTIRDEFADTKNEFWNKTANSESDLKSQMSNINANQISYVAGTAYGDRFTIAWITFSRYYYGEGNELMKTAKAKSKAGDWDGAVSIWKDILGKDNREFAGKAAYNIAVACEVKGELDLAKEWLEKSFSEFGNQEAKAYLSIIDARIEDRKQLNIQMKEGEK